MRIELTCKDAITALSNESVNGHTRVQHRGSESQFDVLPIIGYLPAHAIRGIDLRLGNRHQGLLFRGRSAIQHCSKFGYLKKRQSCFIGVLQRTPGYTDILEQRLFRVRAI